MSIESRSSQYGILFGHWRIDQAGKPLGSGSGGRTAVFRLKRTDDFPDTGALKVINLIEETGRLEDLPEQRRLDYILARERCSTSAAGEVELMAKLQSETNIVDYKDHGIVDWEDANGFGRDMLIRMELLKDLRSKIREDDFFSESEVVKVGLDICNALILCHGKQILHRDIKPENIFVNEDGNYKLGDFGVSRILSNSTASKAETGVGTPEYAAPEQFRGQYDTRVDIYSLGLVLYELTNRNRLPFASTSYARQADIQKRQLGTPLPAPCDASPGLAAVILKACAFKMEDRFQTAEEFRQALINPQIYLAQTIKDGGNNTTVITNGGNNATVKAGSGNETQYAGRGFETEYAGSGNGTVTAGPGNVTKETGTGNYAVQTGPEKHTVITKTRPDDDDSFDRIIEKLIPILALIAAALVVVALLLWMKGKEKVRDETAGQTESTQTEPYLAVRTHCEDLSAGGDYLAAVSYLVAEVSTDPALEPMLFEYEQMLEQSVLEGARSLAEEGKYRLAIQSLWDAGKQYAFPSYRETAGEYMTQLATLNQIAAGREHTVRLYDTGRVAAVGREYDGQCNVSNWANVKAIVAGDHHTVGLMENGTVIAVGKNTLSQCNVSGWNDVKLIAAGDYHTVALTHGGILLGTGMNNEGQSNVSGLYANEPVVSVAAGYFHTVALHADGTVTAIGDNTYGQCNVYGWTEIVAVYAGTYHTLGLRADGTVVAAGSNDHGECNVQGWENMAQLCTGDYISVGLRDDGTVAVCGETTYGQYTATEWTDIIAVAAGRYHIIGMRADGTLVCAGDNPVGQGDVHMLE